VTASDTTPAFTAFTAKFKLEELVVRRYAHWTWSVRPAQGTLGASVISLNRPAVAWSQVDAGENAGLSQVVVDVEAVLRRQFSFDKINYLMLMMVDEHVHFHVFPRYSGERTFGGRIWLDTNWPKPPDLQAGDFGAETLGAVRDTLRRG
jgi:diadenosine tetraphosphate (Ap4A) HIT family hydrolase